MLEKLILAAANAVLYARHPRPVWRYCKQLRHLPNVANPARYAERMLWRKILDHNPQFVVFSDKLATKEYCRSVCPDLPLARTLWVGDDADAIPDELLAQQVFVKANHGFNFHMHVRGKVDRVELKARADHWLRSSHGTFADQWAYSRVVPKLFVEEAVGDPEDDLLDFNIRASNGKAILGSVIGHNKTAEAWVRYLDLEGNPTAGPGDEDGAAAPVLPDGLDIRRPYRLALNYAEKLSRGVDYARFDFMWNGQDLYGGEITVYPSAGVHDITNTAVHRATMAGWDLEVSHFLRASHTGLCRLYAQALRRRLQPPG